MRSLVQLALVGWFILLAVAEAVAAPGDTRRREGSHDARLVTNFGLTAFNVAASALLPIAQITSSVVGDRLGLGVANIVPLPWIVTFALLFLLDSFAGYWVHRLMHAAPLLWRVHRVHHADRAVDVSTSLRNHPLEFLVTVPVSSVVVLLIGAPLSAVIAVQSIVVAATIWQHADIALPRRGDRVLARAIFTPRLHRLHHNPERAIHDTNFGESIILWDWLFGTLNRSDGRRAVGLGDMEPRPDHLLEQLWSPLRPIPARPFTSA